MKRGSQLRLQGGDFASLCFRLGCEEATGVLTLVQEGGREELLILRRGRVYTRDSDALGRKTRRRLELLAVTARKADFDGGLAAYPPSLGTPFCLASWARQHIEAQIDSVKAQAMVSELAGVRLSVTESKWPPLALLDDTDLRILKALKNPRRIDQVWPIARTPRFRLLSFVHFLRTVELLREEGVATRRFARASSPPPSDKAMRLLGLRTGFGPEEAKRAYRRLARELHPDLAQPSCDDEKRRFERQLADISSAYRELTAS